MLHRFAVRLRTAAPFAALALLVSVQPARAQDEAALRSYFEGKRVVLKIDMPGTSDGVDVRADAATPVDFRRLGDRLRTYGTALHEHESVTVTLVKLKKDLIEFQLNGGGFGTFSDDTSTSVSLRRVDKSSREKDLEKRVEDENDSRRRRELQRDLDELRERRERENRRIDAEKERLEEIKKQRIAEQRLRGGSRFNLRYTGAVPSGIGPEDVMAALRDYVDFAPGSSNDLSAGASAKADRAPGAPGDVVPRKGMLRADAEQAFGKPVDSSTSREGTLTVTKLVFVTDAERISAEFVEDVLVRYAISSK